MRLALLCLLLAACSGGETANPQTSAAETTSTEAKTAPKEEPTASTASTSPEATPATDATTATPGADQDWSTPPAGSNPALLDPSKATEKAPDTYKVKFTTTKGDFVVEVHRDWAPQGADRFYNLVKMGFYDQAEFFRAIDGFMVQFGISGYGKVNDAWHDATIKDDPVKQSNKRGYVTFATAGPDTRTTQVFINYSDRNAQLDAMGFAPFGQVVEGMDVVDGLYKGYGEGYPRGNGPDQGKLQAMGNRYLRKDFPKLDYIQHAEITK